MSKTKITKTTKNNLPIIQVLSTKENDDDSLDIEIEYQKEWVDKVKEELPKKLCI